MKRRNSTKKSKPAEPPLSPRESTSQGSIEALFEEVRKIAISQKKRPKQKIDALRTSFLKHYDNMVSSKQNVWYKKYDLELKKRQELESKIRRLEEGFKILEKETMNMSKNSNYNSAFQTEKIYESQMLSRKEKSELTEKNEQNQVLTTQDEVQDAQDADNEPNQKKGLTDSSLTISKEMSSYKQAEHEPKWLIYQKKLHPVFESLKEKEEENSILRDTISKMERQGVELIKRNKTLVQEVKLLKRESNVLDEMIKKMNNNMSFLMSENDKMKKVYKDEIERQREKINDLEEIISKYKTQQRENDKSGAFRGRVATEPSRNIQAISTSYLMNSSYALNSTEYFGKKAKIEKLTQENEALIQENKILRRNVENPDQLINEHLADKDLLVSSVLIDKGDPSNLRKKLNEDQLAVKKKKRKLTEKERSRLSQEISRITGEISMRGKGSKPHKFGNKIKGSPSRKNLEKNKNTKKRGRVGPRRGRRTTLDKDGANKGRGVSSGYAEYADNDDGESYYCVLI